MTTQWKYLPELPEEGKGVSIALRGMATPIPGNMLGGRWYGFQIHRFEEIEEYSVMPFLLKDDTVYAWAELPELAPIEKPKLLDTTGKLIEIVEEIALKHYASETSADRLKDTIIQLVEHLRQVERVNPPMGQQGLADLLQQGLPFSTYLQIKEALLKPDQPFEVIITGSNADLKNKPVENTTESLGFTEEHLDVAMGRSTDHMKPFPRPEDLKVTGKQISSDTFEMSHETFIDAIKMQDEKTVSSKFICSFCHQSDKIQSTMDLNLCDFCWHCTISTTF